MLLAIDTATRMLSIALYDGQQVCAEQTWTTRNQHTVELMPAIQQLMARVEVATSTLTLIGVSEGPGSFNGLRIGFSTAKGLAMALNIPLVTIPTLNVIAASQPQFDGTLLAVVQAGRGRVCTQSYRWESGSWKGQNDTQIVSWSGLVALVDSSTLIAGEIDTEGRTTLDSSIIASQVTVASPAWSLRRAGFLAQLAWQRWQQDRIDQSLTAIPLYLHQPGVPHP
jgi:tRNA threonylcarbamoyladenosine biosynthesis protein TsaB